MKTPNGVLMASARATLKGKWRLALKVTALYFLISILLSAIPVVGSIASFVATGPLMVGLAMFWLAFSRNQNPSYKLMFGGFNNWWKSFKAYFLVGLYTFLWTLLLIVPGIIAAFAYSQTFYILADDSTIGANAAITKSKEMMKGNKWKLFCLGLRFIGWMLLCIPTLGIGFLWLVPYMSVSMAKFYEDVKGNGTPVPEVPKEAPTLQQA